MSASHDHPVPPDFVYFQSSGLPSLDLFLTEFPKEPIAAAAEAVVASEIKIDESLTFGISRAVALLRKNLRKNYQTIWDEYFEDLAKNNSETYQNFLAIISHFKDKEHRIKFIEKFLLFTNMGKICNLKSYNGNEMSEVDRELVTKTILNYRIERLISNKQKIESKIATLGSSIDSIFQDKTNNDENFQHLARMLTLPRPFESSYIVLDSRIEPSKEAAQTHLLSKHESKRRRVESLPPTKALPIKAGSMVGGGRVFQAFVLTTLAPSYAELSSSLPLDEELLKFLMKQHDIGAIDISPLTIQSFLGSANALPLEPSQYIQPSS